VSETLTFPERCIRNDARHAAAAERNRLAAERSALLVPASQEQGRTAGRLVLSHPLAAHAGNRVTPEVARQATGDLAVLGRQLWTELHSYTATYSGDRPAALAWLAAFGRRVPSAGCDCRRSWGAVLKELPVEPYLTDAASLSRWGWMVHEAINRKLGRPAVSFAEAVRRWGWPEVWAEAWAETLPAPAPSRPPATSPSS
jgi:hypothetical protein